SQVSAAALLVRLGPWLTNARKALLAAPPFADADDIAQQLSLEVLAKAARWVPRCEDHWIPRRLAEEAERRVRRVLRREEIGQPAELDERMQAKALEDPRVLKTPAGMEGIAEIQLMCTQHAE